MRNAGLFRTVGRSRRPCASDLPSIPYCVRARARYERRQEAVGLDKIRRNGDRAPLSTSRASLQSLHPIKRTPRAITDTDPPLGRSDSARSRRRGTSGLRTRTRNVRVPPCAEKKRSEVIYVPLISNVGRLVGRIKRANGSGRSRYCHPTSLVTIEGFSSTRDSSLRLTKDSSRVRLGERERERERETRVSKRACARMRD